MDGETISTNVAISDNPPSDSNLATAPANNGQAVGNAIGGIDSVHGELAALREKLSEYEGRERRVLEEAAMRDLFPEVEFDKIPDEVYELSRTALPLAAAYALYLRRAELRELRAKQAAAQAVLKSAGRVDSTPERDEFSTAEIARMSRAEVKRNYSKILRSLGRK